MPRYTPPAKPFKPVDMQVANQECKPWNPLLARHDKCPVCKRKVVLHCDDCMLQITGCLCTLKRKIIEDEALTEQERQIADKNKLWTPGRRY